MTTKNLGFFESSSVKKVPGGIKVRTRLISAGQGSSGFYAAEMLQTVGMEAFPAGTKLFYNHPSEQERESHRDVRLIFGKTLTDAEYVEAEQALYAECLVYEKDAEFITQVMNDVDLSIEASGERDTDGNVMLEYSPTNAVALVPVGGRDGKIVDLIEAHINTAQKYGIMENDNSTNQKELPEMTPEEMKAVLTEALEAFSKNIVEALTVKPEVEESETKTDVKALVKALDGAGLPEAAVDRALESENPLEAIESLVELKTQILEAAKDENKVTESDNGGYVVQESKTTERRTPAGWN